MEPIMDLTRWAIEMLAEPVPNRSYDPEEGVSSLSTSDAIETRFRDLIAGAGGRRLIATAGKGADVYELPHDVAAAVQALQELPGGPRRVFVFKDEHVEAFLAQAESRGVQLIDKTAVPAPA